MIRLRKGFTDQEEELFQLWDEMRKRGIKDLEAALLAAKNELGIERRIAMIQMQRYTRCFSDPGQ